MADRILDSSFLHDRLNRWRSGDRVAADELLRIVIARLEKLSRRMLRSFPNVRGIADTDDVLQNSLLRLLRSLQRIKLKGTREFFILAAMHIRRELIDLARRCRRKGILPPHSNRHYEASFPEPKSPTDGSDVDRWILFHQSVDRLPMEEREVVGLIFYHGWKQRQIAELFKVDERTIRRRWATARQNLQLMIGKEFLTD